MRATIAKIHLKNFEHNINFIKKIIPKNTKICIPVKADGYGHGDLAIAKKAIELGIDYFAVATVDEALHLRKNNIQKKILLLGIPQLDEIPDLIISEAEPFVFEEKYISALNEEAKKANKKIGVHLKIDTGMGRLGCNINNCISIASFINSCSNLFLAGVCTHFSVSDSINDDDINFTKNQINKFNECVTNIKNTGIDCGIIHAANSGAVLMYPEAHFHMVRPGIIVYGFPPDKNQYNELLKNGTIQEKLKPVFELETCVSAIVPHTKGETISYGRTWTCDENKDMAVLPIGYADGFFRRFNGHLTVKINGKIYQQVGRICMDQCMIDIGLNHNIKVGDKVTIFSTEDENLYAQNIAEKTDTITYEILCGISKRVPRVYLD